jgi:para-nitrobenzyl esterase
MVRITRETPLEGGRYKAPHTVEIPFVFHNLEASPWTRGVAGAVPIADQVSDAWLAFARSGDPNTGGLPRWPAFDARRRATMVFDATSAVADDPLREQRVAMFAAKGFVG